MTVRSLFLTLSLLSLAGCSTLERTDRVFVAKGYSLNLLFLQIPSSPLPLAEQEVPRGAQIENVNMLGNEIIPLLGLVNRILGVSCAQIGGTVRSGAATRPANTSFDRAFVRIFHDTARGSAVANAKAFHLLFFPGDPLGNAEWRLDRAGVRRITNVEHAPLEWGSLPGVLGNLVELAIGPFQGAEVGGTY